MINELIKQGESKTVEFKERLPNGMQLAKTVSAFANRAGGQIIIGVSDNLSICGLDFNTLDETMDRISNMIHDHVVPMLLPEIFTYYYEKKALIVIKVFPGNATPYYLKSKGKQSGTYIRVGATNKQADLEMIQELERNRLNISYDEDISDEINATDLERLTQMLTDVLRKEISHKHLENLKLIKKSGDQTYFTHAADILIGKPDNCVIYCARFSDDSATEFYDRKEYRGNLIEQVDRVIVFLKNHLNLKGTISTGSLIRKDEMELPETILREAVINAVIHRDYSISGASIKVAVYDNRIDIISPGGLPKTITIEEIYAGRSEIRNKIIARIFKEAGLIEAWGSGIVRMVEICRAKGLGLPIIKEDGLFVCLTLPRRLSMLLSDSHKPKIIINRTGLSKSEIVAEENRQIFEVIKSNAYISQAEIAQLLDISESAVFRRLQALQGQGLIKRSGSKKTGHWVVIGKHLNTSPILKNL